MSFTYSAHILGSTEIPNADRSHLLGYVERNLAMSIAAKPAKRFIFSLEWAYRNHKSMDGTLTREQVKDKLRKQGYVFCDTKDEAEAAAVPFVAELNAIIRQVYGLPQSWPAKRGRQKRPASTA